jgi:hypothetical protein
MAVIMLIKLVAKLGMEEQVSTFKFAHGGDLNFAI